MPRLFGFVPTKKMIEEAKPLIKDEVVETGVAVDVISDGPIMETVLVPVVEPVPSVEVPTYKKVIKKPLPPILMPVKKNTTSILKRKVSLNPLSN